MRFKLPSKGKDCIYGAIKSGPRKAGSFKKAI